MCGDDVAVESLTLVEVGPILMRVCDGCSGPLGHVVGLAGWLRGRLG